MMTEKVWPITTMPSSAPIIASTTAIRIRMVWYTLLNMASSTMAIRNSAMRPAFHRKAMDSSWSSVEPLKATCTLEGKFWASIQS